MSAKWQLTRDGSIATEPYKALLATLDSPRHRKMLQTLIEHIRCVVAGDLEGVMATMVEEPNFVTWGTHGDTGSKGQEATRHKYNGIRAGTGIANQTVKIDHFVVDDHAIAVELTETRLLPWQVAKERGYAIDEEEGHYAVHRHCAVIIPYDEQALIVGEHNFGYGWPPSPNDWERVLDEDIAPDYLQWLTLLVAGQSQ